MSPRVKTNTRRFFRLFVMVLAFKIFTLSLALSRSGSKLEDTVLLLLLQPHTANTLKPGVEGNTSGAREGCKVFLWRSFLM
jgi:hypothetical protein